MRPNSRQLPRRIEGQSPAKLAKAAPSRARSRRLLLLPKGQVVLPMIAAKRELADSGLLISACIVHAIGITVSWVLVFKFDVEIVSAKIWAVIALMWLLWLVVVALSPSRNLRKWIAAVIASSLILAPTVPTLYTFVVWTIEGFAP